MNRNEVGGKPSSAKIFSWTSRVYFGDTDAAGVVFHGKYVYWMEAGRIEFLRHIGTPYSQFVAEKIAFMPVSLTINYEHPLRFEDEFRLDVWIIRCGRASFEVGNAFYVGGVRCATGSVTLAAVDEVKWKPCPVPKLFMDAISDWL